MQSRLIIDRARTGVTNMAVDEALLHDAAANDILTLRIYQWAEPTLSLGYFQKIHDREVHAASRGLPVVRRASGGGALVHDREVTYSLAVPTSHPLARDAEALYDAVHQSLMSWLVSRFKLQPPGMVSLCQRGRTLPAGQQPFLCFQRRSRGDLLINSPSADVDHQHATIDGRHKICGSAQRRHSLAVLQHGGLLLAESDHAPELPGLAELAAVNLNVDQFCAEWPNLVARRLDVEFSVVDEVPENLAIEAEQIAEYRFGSRNWTRRR